MDLIVFGQNFRTSSIAQRERLAVPEAQVEQFLLDFSKKAGVHGVVYVATCNRVEIYAAVDPRFVPDFPAAYLHRNETAFEHLLRVSAGLDSLVLGETEVFGQIKRAYLKALALKVTGPLLNFIFQRAFQAAKQIRSETGIGRHPVSVGTVAMTLLEQIFGRFDALTGLVIGLGEMGGQAAKLLSERGVKKLYGSNRTSKPVEAFMEPIAWEQWKEILPMCDVVVTSTASASPILPKERFVKRDGFQVLIDLGVPRDIDPAIGELESVYLYNVDDLKTIAQKNLAHREAEARSAEGMIEKVALTFIPEWSKRIGIFENRDDFVLADS